MTLVLVQPRGLEFAMGFSRQESKCVPVTKVNQRTIEAIPPSSNHMLGSS
jgi:hypothetical protein